MEDKRSAFDNTDSAEPLNDICRPCREHDDVILNGNEKHGSLVHACDGNGCKCSTCDIVRTVRELSGIWDLFDRAEGWRD